MVKHLALLALAVAGCGKFQDPTIVIDLRALAMVAQPPEQLVDYSTTMLPDPSQVNLVPVSICALVADPGAERPLDYEMTACPPQNDDRCDPTQPMVVIGGGEIQDPETAPTPQPACATMTPSADILNVIVKSAIADPEHGFDSIDFMVEMRVWPPGGTEADAIYGTKGVRIGQTIPAGRTPNLNPTLTEIDYTLADGTTGPLTLGRCVDQAAPLAVAANDQIELLPVEPPGARQVYVVPTFDGGSQQFTENLSYDWFAGDGSWKQGSSGGPIDAFGNNPPLDDTWAAPDATDVGQGLDVPIYVVQRDERLGEAWYESCVHVHP